MKITKIEWLNLEAREGEVFLTDELHSCSAFCYMLDVGLKEGSEFTNTLSAFRYELLPVLKDANPYVRRTPNTPFAHELQGLVESIGDSISGGRETTARVGEFRFTFYDLPGTYQIASLIRARVDRIDI